MKVFTCTPKPFFSTGMGNCSVFSRDMFLQCHAFQELGHESKVVLLDGIHAQRHRDIIRTSMRKLQNPQWWRSHKLDMVVLGAWAMPEYTPIANAIKDAGIRLVVRCDSTGKYSQFGRPFGEVIRDNFWSLQERVPNPGLRSVATAAKTLMGYSPWAREHKVIEHLSYADLICIESPGARDLLVELLTRRNRPEIAARVRYVAHPVKLPQLDVSARRNKQILCVGRWNAYPKNTLLLVKVLIQVLSSKIDYHAVLAGSGEDSVVTELNRMKCPSSVRSRIHILGVVAHDQILELCNQSRINFVSSRWESFNIAAAESLCMGCSVVGPAHIASIRNFVSKDSGTVAVTYSVRALSDALEMEIDAWETRLRDPIKIAAMWRNEVSAFYVSRVMLKIEEVGQGQRCFGKTKVG